MTLEYLGYDEYSTNLKFVGKEEAVKAAKKGSPQTLPIATGIVYKKRE